MNANRPTHVARDLPGGFHLRGMRGTDIDELDAFVTRVFGTIMKEPGPDLMAGIWARELLRGDHPTTRPEDGAVVVDSATDRIVACSFLISQVWRYAGVPFAVGRPELIASDPDYRGRGLIRALMSSVHEQSAALGQVLQGLTGIPFYYRQYGYEPALITEDSRRGPVSGIAPLPGDQPGAIRIRPVAESDLPFITRMYERTAERAMISAIRDETIWRHELISRDPSGDYWHELRIIEDAAGEAIGFFAYVAQLRGESVICTLAELTSDERWPEVAPVLLSWLRTEGEAIASTSGERCNEIEFDWTPVHPFIDVVGNALPERAGPFAWYIRVPDLARFLWTIAPALEARLARSEIAGFSGEVMLTFYPHGFRIGFEQGKLTLAAALTDAPHRAADAAFPARTFLQLLLGSRSIDELMRAFPFETFVRNETARVLLTSIFPKQPSAVWPVA